MYRLRHYWVKLFATQVISEICASDNLSQINVLLQNQFNKFDRNGKNACSYYAIPKLHFLGSLVFFYIHCWECIRDSKLQPCWEIDSMCHFQKLFDMLSDFIILGIFRGAFIQVSTVQPHFLLLVVVMYFSVLHVIQYTINAIIRYFYWCVSKLWECEQTRLKQH